MSSAMRQGIRVVAGLCLLLAGSMQFASRVSAAGSGPVIQPERVTIAGSLQTELGCPGDWQPECAATQLAFDAEDGVWQRVFAIPVGDWEYKAPLNGTWDLNFGANAQPNGPNIGLSLAQEKAVKFYYSHATNWITDDHNTVIAVAPGNFQSELGCNNDWDPSCLRSWLQDPDGDGVFTLTAWLPAGDYEVKVALNETWDVNFGASGAQNGPNIPFSVPSSGGEGGSDVVFSFDAASKLLTVSPDGDAEPPEPDHVTIAGSFQSELGCPGDWQPECFLTALDFDAEDGVWQKVFEIPGGNWEYKAPLNGTWDLNFGANAQPNGPNIGLSLPEAKAVKFFYSNATHWVTDDRNSIIAVAPGNFQSELGCNNDWDPSCLRSWLQDPDGDGIFSFSARLPAGDYEAKVALNETWDVNFGAGGVQNGPNIPFSVPPSDHPRGAEVFFFYDAASHILTVALGDVKGDLRRARAHWLDADTLAWNPASFPTGARARLHADPDAGLALAPDGVRGGLAFDLVEAPAGLPSELRTKYPHLAGLRAFTLPDLGDADRRALLKSQLALSATAADGAPLDATGVQIPGALDALFVYDGALGPAFEGGGVALRVWAPTAQSVDLLLFDGPGATTPAQTVAMTEDPVTGVWSVHGPLDWDRRYYLYQVTVYAPSTGRIETNRVTDPYSLSLAADSRLSQIVDLDAADLAPEGWDALRKPALAAPEDIVLYELHVRDFSIADGSVPEGDRGRFTAFAQAGSIGMRHLRRLAGAGVSHVHVLPAFDFATVPERIEDRLEPAGDLAAYPPDSDRQQAAVAAVKDADGFNWGYDPFHYTVPEGSYATDPDGIARIREFRQMVQALNRAGLRVVMDVVYNHTTAAGQNDKSVLDRIVPGYYHRLNAEGFIETSSCCPNTATEHRMMEKLMLDSALTWVRQYRVDGFRFDLMGHHMKSNMLALRERLDALSPEADGIDGPAIYVYGEGWNFGEVANNARGENAVQANLAGTGIGSFNDRLRDGLRGGSPFGDLRAQGFASGLFTDSNGTAQGDELGELLHRSDWVRIGLAGTLADFEFVDSGGHLRRADEIDYFGQRAGYTADPQESINFASSHDNETLFDAIQLKAAPTATLEERIRLHRIGVDLVALGQGVPFFHAGHEMLRSKSMDRDSFNSGDWFNALDYSLATNSWGRGLPSAEKNQDNWPLMASLLADPTLKPQPADLAATVEHYEQMLRIRGSSPLFRLRTAEAVRSVLGFLNTGPGQVPGLIAMSLSDPDGGIDRRHARIVTLFNAGADAVRLPLADWQGQRFVLHPVQAGSGDPLTRSAGFDAGSGEFFVPARTTAVFVSPRPAAQRIELLIADVEALRDAGQLNSGRAQSLIAKLDNAWRQAAHNADPAAANLLQAFQREAAALGALDRLRAEAAEIERLLRGG